MKDSDFIKYRSKFNKEIEKRDTILKLVHDENVAKYLELNESKPKKEESDLEIVRKVFRNFDLHSEDVFFIEGVYLGIEDGEYVGDIVNEELISDSEVPYLKHKIAGMNRGYRCNYLIKYKVFNPLTNIYNGRDYPYTDEKKGMLFPSYNEAALKANNKITKEELSLLYRQKVIYAKYLLLLKLMNMKYEDVVEYYNNPQNYESIENEVDVTIRKLKLKGSSFSE